MPLKRMDNVGIVVDDLGGTIDFFRELGLELEGRATIVQYKDAYRLCYIRGPEGLLIGLAQELS
jgi:hypothetical protein